MKIATLTRSESGDQGTFGTLVINGVSFYSGELPWRDNALIVSCIPEGTYIAKLDFSPRFQKNLYHLQDVPGRSVVRIHPANYMGDTDKGFRSDLEGCIALGMGLDTDSGQKIISMSRVAIEKFMAILNDEDLQLTIKGA